MPVMKTEITERRVKLEDSDCSFERRCIGQVRG